MPLELVDLVVEAAVRRLVHLERDLPQRPALIAPQGGQMLDGQTRFGDHLQHPGETAGLVHCLDDENFRNLHAVTPLTPSLPSPAVARLHRSSPAVARLHAPVPRIRRSRALAQESSTTHIPAAVLAGYHAAPFRKESPVAKSSASRLDPLDLFDLRSLLSEEERMVQDSVGTPRR